MSAIHSSVGTPWRPGLFFPGLNGWWVLFAIVIATFAAIGRMNLTGVAITFAIATLATNVVATSCPPPTTCPTRCRAG